MYSLRRSLLVLIPALAILGACGGGDDDNSGGDSDDSSGGSPSPTTTTGDDSRSSNGGANISAIKDAVFADGEVHVEVSGDKDFKIDVKGNGLATGGSVLLTFGSDKATVILAFQADSKEAPGGLSVTTEDISTAGEWGTDCTVTMDDGANELKGEFECENVEAVDIRAAKVYEVRMKGNFSVSR